ncbi:MAG: AMP-binding protein, partial [Alphaproteobacteria bacterium]|nr:AMP-binding protein [Alphaproteobacteria bacterium]
MAGTSIYDSGLDKVPANFQPLTPLTLIERAAGIFPDRVAVIHGERRYSWAETYTRARRLGSALSKRGIGVGDTVAIMSPNIPEFYEASFGVPMCGAVLNSLNIRLDAETIAFILGHGESKAILTDREFSGVIKEALRLLGHEIIVIDIDDPLAAGGELIGEMDYEAFIAAGDPDYAWRMPGDEWQSIALNYTSGTTG